MKFLYCLVLCLAVGATTFANTSNNNGPEPDPPGAKRLKIKIPVFGSGGLDMNSGKICPDRCFLCHCATIELDLFKASDTTTPVIEGELVKLYYQSEVFDALILRSGPLKEWTDNKEYDYYIDKESSQSLQISLK
ncbi:MAG: hypothetical protein KDD02_03935 [Phaeodactylibacter sp.]|nr:hypothetical protein [Phaeodactylibacter sp.]MCB9302040.1 hypothetical protein [Lewinellaceae bacterium]